MINTVFRFCAILSEVHQELECLICYHTINPLGL